MRSVLLTAALVVGASLFTATEATAQVVVQSGLFGRNTLVANGGNVTSIRRGGLFGNRTNVVSVNNGRFGSNVAVVNSGRRRTNVVSVNNGFRSNAVFVNRGFVGSTSARAVFVQPRSVFFHQQPFFVPSFHGSGVFVQGGCH